MGAVESKTQAKAWCALGVPMARMQRHLNQESYSKEAIVATPSSALRNVDIKCSRIEQLLECEAIQQNTVCGTIEFKCNVLSLPTVINAQGTQSVRAADLAGMFAENYSDKEIHNMCVRIAQVHNSRKHEQLRDIISCASRKLSTGTYHKPPRAAAARVWDVNRMCGWLSSLFTFQRNAFFAENGIPYEGLLNELRSISFARKQKPEEGESSDYEHDDDSYGAQVIMEDQLEKIFEFWSETHLKELAQGMPHYVDGSDEPDARFHCTDKVTSHEGFLNDKQATEQCCEHFRLLNSKTGIESDGGADRDDPDEVTTQQATNDSKKPIKGSVAPSEARISLTQLKRELKDRQEKLGDEEMSAFMDRIRVDKDGYIDLADLTDLVTIGP